MANAINYQEIMEELAKPFELEDIEWRVQSASKNSGKTKILVLPYVTSRAIMNRLDRVVGALWRDRYEPVLANSTPALRCILSLKIGDEWISREDAAELTEIEPIKGGYSNSLKRCGVKWGIGRYLYNLPQFWVELTNNGKHRVYGKFKIDGKLEQLQGYFNTPKLPVWALPTQAPNSPKANPSPNQGQQRQQAPNNSNQHNQSNTIPMSEAERQASAIVRVNPVLEYLGIPVNLVPQLLEQACGATVPYEQASASNLGKLFHLLKPAKVYVENCSKFGLNEEGMLYYANITLAPFMKRPLENVYELPFFMKKELTTTTLELVRADKATSSQPQVS